MGVVILFHTRSFLVFGKNITQILFVCFFSILFAKEFRALKSFSRQYYNKAGVRVVAAASAFPPIENIAWEKKNKTFCCAFDSSVSLWIKNVYSSNTA